VVAAAINHNDSGVFVSLPAPARHHDIIAHLAQAGHPKPIRGTQGFMLDDGTFVMRKAALYIAEEAGQLIREPIARGHGLFSEDVW
jgi:hypothetical protein